LHDFLLSRLALHEPGPGRATLTPRSSSPPVEEGKKIDLEHRDRPHRNGGYRDLEIKRTPKKLNQDLKKKVNLVQNPPRRIEVSCPES